MLSSTTGSAFAAVPQDKGSVSMETLIPQKLDSNKYASVLAPAIVAAPTAKINFEKTAVKSVAAPVVVPPKVAEAPVAVAAPAPEAPAAAVATTPVAAKKAAPVAAAPAPAPAPAPGTAVGNPVSTGKGQAIAAAALAQVGVEQDCTMLATNSLKAVGINFHGWPAGYLSLGTKVSAAEAQPGDLLVYANGGGGQAHVAVYIGNGKAVHGGWNGHTTAVFSANVGSGPTYVRVR